MGSWNKLKKKIFIRKHCTGHFYITTFIDNFHSKHVLLAHLKGHSHIFTRGFYTALEMPTFLSLFGGWNVHG